MAHVLLVEDDELVALLVRRLLERAGHTVTVASDGSRAHRALSGMAAPDVVITDILMPGADGFETIRFVRDRFPAARIVAMSAGTVHLPADRLLPIALSLGADRVLPKPFACADLLHLVSELAGAPVC